LGFIVGHGGFFLLVQGFRGPGEAHLARGLTAGSSWIIHLYTNECIRMN
jgi:hypothetical protein